MRIRVTSSSVPNFTQKKNLYIHKHSRKQINYFFLDERKKPSTKKNKNL